MRGAGERGVDLGGVAIVIVERDVVRDVIVELRRAGLGGLRGVGHGGQRLDIEFDGLAASRACASVSATTKATGSPTKRTLSVISAGRLVCRQRRAVAALQRQAAGEGVVVGGGEVRAGPDAEHARHRLGGGRVDALDDAVGMAGAHDPAIGLAGQGEIVGVLALAAHQRVVFLAAHRLPDTVFLQCDSVFEGGRPACDLALKNT